MNYTHRLLPDFKRKNIVKKFTLILSLSLTAMLSACDKAAQSNLESSLAASSNFELNVKNWGPQLTKIGTNANVQPDGSMGIWIEVADTRGLGEAQVLLSGQPAKLTTVQDKLITAAITTDQLASAGDKAVAIKQIGTGKIFSVGTFKIIEK